MESILTTVNNFRFTDSHKPSSAKSDTTSVRPQVVSFELRNKRRSAEDDGQPLRIVQSSPALKKGSPTRKLSYGKKGIVLKFFRLFALYFLKDFSELSQIYTLQDTHVLLIIPHVRNVTNIQDNKLRESMLVIISYRYVQYLELIRLEIFRCWIVVSAFWRGHTLLIEPRSSLCVGGP